MRDTGLPVFAVGKFPCFLGKNKEINPLATASPRHRGFMIPSKSEISVGSQIAKKFSIFVQFARGFCSFLCSFYGFFS